MIQIFASSNSRYYLLRRDNELSLYRVPARLWCKEFPGLQNVVGVGNRGDVFFRTFANGLCRHSVDPHAESEKVYWENSLLVANEGAGRVEKVAINSEGTEMFAEYTMPSQTLGSSWRSFFGPGEAATGYDHVLYRIGESAGKLYHLPRATTLSAHGEYLWAVSRDFTYCGVAVLQKRGLYEVKIYRIRTKEVACAFTLPDCQIRQISIDEFGRISLEVEDDGHQRMLFVHDTGSNCYNVPLQADATVLNVWKDRVCWMSSTELAVQRLDGEMICRVSTEPLNTFGVEYYFLFNHNNDMSLAMGVDEELVITPINPDNLVKDAQRWTRLSERKIQRVDEAEIRAREEQELKEAKEKRYMQMRNSLDSALDSIKKRKQKPESADSLAVGTGAKRPPLVLDLKKKSEAAAPVKAREPRDQAVILAELKGLRDRYAAGKVEQGVYLKQLEALNAELLGG